VEPICLQGRTLSGDDLRELRALIAQHSDWHRTALSRHLCELWNWRNGAGRLKDMAARTLLLKLQVRGLIELPPPQTRTGRPCAQAPPRFAPELLPATSTPIEDNLASLLPVSLELAHTPELRRRVRQLLTQYHYRGFQGAVGENVQYLARDVRGRELAVMVFGAAAWKVAVRDRFIGWSVAQRQHRLGLLARATRRLSADWQARYGHPVWLVETFVEQDRFAGTAYQAAGWLPLGPTTGRTRQDRQRTLQSPLKSVWVRALHPRFLPYLTTP
jgi:hypothetical protein